MIILQNTLQATKTAIYLKKSVCWSYLPLLFFNFLIVIPVHNSRLWTEILYDLLFYYQNEESFAAVCIIYLFLRNSSWDNGTLIFFYTLKLPFLLSLMIYIYGDGLIYPCFILLAY